MATIIGLLLTPYLLRHLGGESYGIWTLALSLSITHGIMSFMDLGVASSVVKMVGSFSASGDIIRMRETISGGIIFFSAVGLLAVFLIIGLAEHLVVGLFNIPEAYTGEAITLFRTMGWVVFFEMAALGLTATLQGLQEFSLFKAVQAACLIVQVALIVLFLSLGGGLVSLGGALLLSALLKVGLAYILVRQKMPDWQFTWKLSGEVRRQLMKTSGVIMLIRFQAAIYRSMDRIIVGAYLVPLFLTDLDLISKLAGGGISAVSVVASMMVSPASALVAKQESGRLKDLFLAATKYSVLVAMPVVLLVAFHGADVLSFWVGAKFAHLWDEAILLIVHVVFVALIASAQNMLIGGGHAGRVAIIASATTLINLVLSLLWVTRFGLRGVILGTVISGLIAAVAVTFAAAKAFDFSLMDYLRKMLVPAFLPAILSSLLYLPVIFGFFQGGFLWLVLSLAALTYFYSASIYSATCEERRSFLSYFKLSKKRTLL